MSGRSNVLYWLEHRGIPAREVATAFMRQQSSPPACSRKEEISPFAAKLSPVISFAYQWL